MGLTGGRGGPIGGLLKTGGVSGGPQVSGRSH